MRNFLELTVRQEKPHNEAEGDCDDSLEYE
jgi:hypothetical protein